MNLIVNEIFSSINGEINKQHQGSLCTFIRLQGCNLRCGYCDTPRSQDIKGCWGIPMSISDILKEITKQGNINITITGGEPLLQKEALCCLINKLHGRYQISVETNGSIAIPFEVPSLFKVHWIIDYKLPDSGSYEHMFPSNFKNLVDQDIVKFVVSSEEDFDLALGIAHNIRKSPPGNCTIAFSPCSFSQKMTPEKLYKLMQNKFLKNIGAVFSLQLHKIIGVS